MAITADIRIGRSRAPPASTSAATPAGSPGGSSARKNTASSATTPTTMVRPIRAEMFSSVPVTNRPTNTAAAAASTTPITLSTAAQRSNR